MKKHKHNKNKTLKKLQSVTTKKANIPVERIRIRRHRFHQLRNDSDFLAMIKVGRVVNAVISGIQFMSDYMDDLSPVGRRQFYRAFFTTCGFMYEGLNVVISLRLTYISKSYFNDLNLLIGEKYDYHRKVLKEIRHSIAFHLDSNDKSTKLALSNLNLSRYDLMSGKSQLMMDLYFDMADTIDLNYLIDKFKDDRPELEILEELIVLVRELMTSFGAAGHEFLSGLAKEMNFSDYVD